MLDEAGIAPSSLTSNRVERLASGTSPKGPQQDTPRYIARRFTKHLIDIGVAQPVPLTEADRACGVAGGLRYVSRQTAWPQPA